MSDRRWSVDNSLDSSAGKLNTLRPSFSELEKPLPFFGNPNLTLRQSPNSRLGGNLKLNREDLDGRNFGSNISQSMDYGVPPLQPHNFNSLRAPYRERPHSQRPLINDSLPYRLPASLDYSTRQTLYTSNPYGSTGSPYRPGYIHSNRASYHRPDAPMDNHDYDVCLPPKFPPYTAAPYDREDRRLMENSDYFEQNFPQEYIETALQGQRPNPENRVSMHDYHQLYPANSYSMIKPKGSGCYNFKMRNLVCVLIFLISFIVCAATVTTYLFYSWRLESSNSLVARMASRSSNIGSRSVAQTYEASLQSGHAKTYEFAVQTGPHLLTLFVNRERGCRVVLLGRKSTHPSYSAYDFRRVFDYITEDKVHSVVSGDTLDSFSDRYDQPLNSGVWFLMFYNDGCRNRITTEILTLSFFLKERNDMSCSAKCNGHGKCDALDRCICDSGYTGAHCESKIEIPCQNFGINSDGTCKCTEGLYGNKCQFKQTGCFIDPDYCSNNGVCVQGECVCKNGYRGPRCNEATCVSPCGERQHCVNGKCVCQPQYKGPGCSQLNCAAPDACSNHGTCTKKNCSCNVGWTGVTCHIDRCNDNCSGNGNCASDELLGWRCQCDPEFIGEYCNVRLPASCDDSCSSNPLCCHKPSCSKTKTCLNTYYHFDDSTYYSQPPFLARIKSDVINKKIFGFDVPSFANLKDVSIIRGRVLLNESGNLFPVQGVSVRAKTSAAKTTNTSANGWFDYVVNANSPVTLEFTLSSHEPKIHVIRHLYKNQFTVIANPIVIGGFDFKPSFSCLKSIATSKFSPLIASDLPLERFAPENGKVVDLQEYHSTLDLKGIKFHFSSARLKLSSIIRVQVSKELPHDIGHIFVHVIVAGVQMEKTVLPSANKIISFEWDRRDAFGWKVYGSVDVKVRVGYEFVNCGKHVEWKTLSTHTEGFSCHSSLWTLDNHHCLVKRKYLQPTFYKGDGSIKYLSLQQPIVKMVESKIKPIALTSWMYNSFITGDQHGLYLGSKFAKVFSFKKLKPIYYLSSFEDLLYMTDPQSEIIYKFNFSQNHFIQAVLLKGRGYCEQEANSDCGDGKLISSGNVSLTEPRGIAVSSNGTVYFIDGRWIRYILHDRVYTLKTSSAARAPSCTLFSIDELALRYPQYLVYNYQSNSLFISDSDYVYQLHLDGWVRVVIGPNCNDLIREISGLTIDGEDRLIVSGIKGGRDHLILRQKYNSLDFDVFVGSREQNSSIELPAFAQHVKLSKINTMYFDAYTESLFISDSDKSFKRLSLSIPDDEEFKILDFKRRELYSFNSDSMLVAIVDPFYKLTTSLLYTATNILSSIQNKFIKNKITFDKFGMYTKVKNEVQEVEFNRSTIKVATKEYNQNYFRFELTADKRRLLIDLLNLGVNYEMVYFDKQGYLEDVQVKISNGFTTFQNVKSGTMCSTGYTSRGFGYFTGDAHNHSLSIHQSSDLSIFALKNDVAYWTTTTSNARNFDAFPHDYYFARGNVTSHLKFYHNKTSTVDEHVLRLGDDVLLSSRRSNRLLEVYEGSSENLLSVSQNSKSITVGYNSDDTLKYDLDNTPEVVAVSYSRNDQTRNPSVFKVKKLDGIYTSVGLTTPVFSSYVVNLKIPRLSKNFYIARTNEEKGVKVGDFHIYRSVKDDWVVDRFDVGNGNYSRAYKAKTNELYGSFGNQSANFQFNENNLLTSLVLSTGEKYYLNYTNGYLSNVNGLNGNDQFCTMHHKVTESYVEHTQKVLNELSTIDAILKIFPKYDKASVTFFQKMSLFSSAILFSWEHKSAYSLFTGKPKVQNSFNISYFHNTHCLSDGILELNVTNDFYGQTVKKVYKFTPTLKSSITAERSSKKNEFSSRISSLTIQVGKYSFVKFLKYPAGLYGEGTISKHGRNIFTERINRQHNKVQNHVIHELDGNPTVLNFVNNPEDVNSLKPGEMLFNKQILKFNGLGQLVRVSLLGNREKYVEYKYDYLGRRIYRLSAMSNEKTRTIYYYQDILHPSRLTSVYDVTTSILTKYSYDLNGHLIKMVQNHIFSKELVFYVSTDINGTPFIFFNPFTNFTKIIMYGGSGVQSKKEYLINENEKEDFFVPCHVGFNGGIADPELQLMLINGKVYSPVGAMFLQPDLHVFTQLFNNPLQTHLFSLSIYQPIENLPLNVFDFENLFSTSQHVSLDVRFPISTQNLIPTAIKNPIKQTSQDVCSADLLLQNRNIDFRELISHPTLRRTPYIHIVGEYFNPIQLPNF